MMPGMDGFSGLRHLRAEAPEVPLVIVSVKERAEDVRRGVEAGAAGYVPKSSSPDVLLGALRLVLSGGVYLPPHILEGALTDGARSGEESNGHNLVGGQVMNLTTRQRDVLDLLIEGMSNRDIARSLGLSSGTVKIHVSSILKAFKVTNRTQAVIAAKEILRSDG